MRNRTYGNSLALTFAGWVTRSQQDAIEYLKHNMTLSGFAVTAQVTVNAGLITASWWYDHEVGLRVPFPGLSESGHQLASDS